MKANELKKGFVLRIDGKNILIKQVQVQTAASRSGNTLYKVRGADVISRQKFERAFKGDDVVDMVELSRRPVQLLFRDNQSCTFMDVESYEQFVLDNEVLDEDLLYISDGMEGIQALLADEKLLGIELPVTITLKIVDCAPSIKGASASARTKPATLATGLVVQVPEYLAPGDVIKVNTETGDFVSRA